jgi:signal transduction histidine kinase
VAADELARLRPWLDEEGITCLAELDPATARLSELEVRRIVRALLENVVRHTARGTTATLRARTEGHRVLLAVEDDGPGVANPELETIFERFSRVDTARTPTAGTGAGLGLAIVRAIVERRSGTVAASRGDAGGLRVEVWLPLDRRARGI